jgi:excisionase family DNA binding protein
MWLRQEMSATERRDRVPFSVDAWRMVKEFDAVATRHVAVKTAVEKQPAHILEEVSTTEAARILCISRQSVLARIQRRTLPARRDASGHYRIARENLKGSTHD